MFGIGIVCIGVLSVWVETEEVGMLVLVNVDVIVLKSVWVEIYYVGIEFAWVKIVWVDIFYNLVEMGKVGMFFWVDVDIEVISSSGGWWDVSWSSLCGDCLPKYIFKLSGDREGSYFGLSWCGCCRTAFVYVFDGCLFWWDGM